MFHFNPREKGGSLGESVCCMADCSTWLRSSDFIIDCSNLGVPNWEYEGIIDIPADPDFAGHLWKEIWIDCLALPS